MTFQALLRTMLGVCVVLCTGAIGWAQAPVSLDAPATAPGGSKVPVKWVGPALAYDMVGVVAAGSSDATLPRAFHGSYVRRGNPVHVLLPEAPGEYELRYLQEKPKGTILARRRITALPLTATLDVSGTALTGVDLPVRFTGPKNEYDRIGAVKPGAPERTALIAGSSDFASKGSPLRITMPKEPGEYEIRYITGQLKATLARARLTVKSGAVTIHVPASVTADTNFSVNWTGPNEEFDRIQLSGKGAPWRNKGPSEYTSKGSPLGFRAPTKAGEYELRYLFGESGTILGKASFTVKPGSQEPGWVRVTPATQGAGYRPTRSVEVILDASGSMLERIGSERRMDIAKRSLEKLTAETIPAGTPFALRVIGRGSDTCQSELDIPLAPLDRAAAAWKIAALEAKNHARTPIGAALDKVASDLGSAQGERLVILVTDGEETCGGNPARSIEKLGQAGVNVRVNIVGFAVSDERTAARFTLWATKGGGSYFDARDAQALADAFSQAVRPAFEIRNAQKDVVAQGSVGGEDIPLMPGAYSVALKGAKGESKSITVRAKQTSSVSL
jgi:hypothetical protein